MWKKLEEEFFAVAKMEERKMRDILREKKIKDTRHTETTENQMD